MYRSQERDFVVEARTTHRTTPTGTYCLIPGQSLGAPAASLGLLNWALSLSPPFTSCRRGSEVSQTSWVCLSSLVPVPRLTHRNDVVLAEAQLIIIVALKIQQCLGSAAPVSGTGHIVLVVPLVALHAVVWGQILAGTNMRAERHESPQVTPSYLPKLACPHSQTFSCA